MPRFTECRKCMCWMMVDEKCNLVPGVDDDDVEHVTCYRHAPRPALKRYPYWGKGFNTEFPKTFATDGCFEGVQRPKAKRKESTNE